MENAKISYLARSARSHKIDFHNISALSVYFI